MQAAAECLGYDPLTDEWDRVMRWGEREDEEAPPPDDGCAHQNQIFRMAVPVMHGKDERHVCAVGQSARGQKHAGLLQEENARLETELQALQARQQRLQLEVRT